MSFGRRQDETRCFWSYHDEVRCQSHTYPTYPITGMYFSGETSWGIGLVIPLKISPPFGVTSWVNVMSHRPSQLSGGCYSKDHPSIGPHTFDPYHCLNHTWRIWDSTRRSSVATFPIVGESLHRNCIVSPNTSNHCLTKRGPNEKHGKQLWNNLKT